MRGNRAGGRTRASARESPSGAGRSSNGVPLPMQRLGPDQTTGGMKLPANHRIPGSRPAIGPGSGLDLRAVEVSPFRGHSQGLLAHPHCGAGSGVKPQGEGNPHMSHVISAVSARVHNAFYNAREKEEGQTLVEYALIIALVSLAAIAALGFLSGQHPERVLEGRQRAQQRLRLGPGRRLHAVARPASAPVAYPAGGAGNRATGAESPLQPDEASRRRAPGSGCFAVRVPQREETCGITGGDGEHEAQTGRQIGR